MLGVDLARIRSLVVKSRGHFRAAFDEVFEAERILEVDVPGLTTPVLARVAWRRMPRPIYPLDADTSWSGAR
jgi:microcystin degradation protein MlrC